MVEMAHNRLVDSCDKMESPASQQYSDEATPALQFGKRIGNAYTASLYISLMSLLENSEVDYAGNRLGLFSYGSGCVGEFFSGIVASDYKSVQKAALHQNSLQSQRTLSYPEYEEFMRFEFPIDGGEHTFPQHTRGPVRLAGVQGHKRIYAPGIAPNREVKR